jgi:hypothetical protein
VGELTLLGVLEVLDRDGQVRQTYPIAQWPVRVGRALDNDLVLPDPHVAPYHLTIDAAQTGLALHVGETINGIAVGSRRLRSGEQRAIDAAAAPAEWVVGRTHLRLRLPQQEVPAELPLAAAATRTRRFGPVLTGLLVLLAALSFNTWLETDPDNLGRSLGGMLLATALGIAVWCGSWALLSKTFTRQTSIGWHLKVFLFASIAWMICDVVPELLGFALSWPWISDFGFIASYAVGATALYFHLRAVEPARPRLMRSVAVTAFVAGVGLSLWFNYQRSDRFGAELYMSHLFPPALRIARPVATDRFVDGLTQLKPLLDKRAKEAPRGEGSSDIDVDE